MIMRTWMPSCWRLGMMCTALDEAQEDPVHHRQEGLEGIP